MYQPPSTFPPATSSVRKVALYFGLRAGLLLGIALSVLLVYWNHGPDSAFGDLTSATSLFLWIAGCMGAGYLTARKIGKMSAGLTSGLWTGGIAGVFIAGTILVGIIYAYGFGSFEWLFSIIASYFSSLIFLILLSLGAGAGLGALGGLIGQSFFARASTPPVPQPIPQYQHQQVSSSQTNDPSRQ